MKCYHHPSKDAVVNCGACNKPICRDCAEMYGVSDGEYEGQSLCYDCTTQLVAANVTLVGLLRKKTKMELIIVAVGVIIGAIIGGSMGAGIGPVILVGLIGGGGLHVIKAIGSFFSGAQALASGNVAGAIKAFFGLFTIVIAPFKTVITVVTRLRQIKQADEIIASDSQTLQEMRDYFAYTQAMENKTASIDLAKLANEGGELFNNKYARAVLDKGEQTAFLSMKGCKIDLGGIGKGYAADACCDIYKEMGTASAFINLGGNVKTFSINSSQVDNKKWTVGLQHPDKPRGSCYGAIICSNQSVVTSGAYERFVEINGKKYHHLIDGNTGYPSESDLKSVTVISKSSIQADAISTAAFVLGLNKGVQLVYKSKCTGAVFFTKSNQIYITQNTKQYMKLIENLPCYEM